MSKPPADPVAALVEQARRAAEALLAEEADRDFTPLVEEARRAAAALLATGERESRVAP